MSLILEQHLQKIHSLLSSNFPNGIRFLKRKSLLYSIPQTILTNIYCVLAMWHNKNGSLGDPGAVAQSVY